MGAAAAAPGGGTSPTPAEPAEAIGSTGAMATAMAEQAKAMAAMAATYARQDGGTELLSDLTGDHALGFRGARGTTALQSWRKLLQDKPTTVTARVRSNRNQALVGLGGASDVVPSMRNYFATEVPFGHAKTAAYLVFGLADVSDLMEGGRWHEAEALVSLLLAASEQAALQEWQWSLAWVMTFLAEPPWTRIRGHAPAAQDLKSVSKLADPHLLAAAVGHLKDVMAISEAQRRSGTAPPSGKAEGSSEVAPKGRGRRGGKGGSSAAGAGAAPAAEGAS